MSQHRGSAESPPRPVDSLLNDQSQRWKRGDRLPVEAYLEQQPEMGTDADQVLDLVYHEILLRVRQGEAPQLEEYRQRFPDLGDELRALFEVHQVLSLGSALPSTNNGGGLVYPAAEEVPPPPVSVAGYEILGELGRGGMGIVYQAKQVGLNRLVALKMIRSGSQASLEQVTRFRAEAEAIARLRHPNIVQIYEIGECEGRPYFSMEYVDGGSLAQHLTGEPQAPRPSAELVETLARAMHTAHERGIIHRDLKPANILIADCRLQIAELNSQSAICNLQSVIPKITDFGLAKDLDADSLQTRSGSVVGTPSYMAPEQTSRRRGVIGPPTDVYALGAILYELLTGRPPFRGETAMDTLWQVAHDDPLQPRQLQPKVPRDLETICVKCLQKDPRKRYASAADLADDLRRFLSGQSVRARPTPAWERAWKWVRRRPVAAVSSLFACLLLLMLVIAHEVHLTAAVARAQAAARVAEDHRNRTAALASLENGLHNVEGAVNARHWQDARLQLAALRAQMSASRERFPDDAELASLQGRLDPLEGQIEGRLTDEERYQRLRRYRDDIAFQATRFAGLDRATRRQQMQSLATAALALFHVRPDEGGELVVASPYFSPQQVREVHEACFEMILNLADAVADAGPDGAKDALALLDRASRLGIVSASYHRRRAVYLERLGDRAAARSAREVARGLREPQPAFEFFLRGLDLCQDGQQQAALEQFERAVSLQPDHFGAHYALAVCYLRLRDGRADHAQLALARASLNQCINQQPEHVWPYLLRGFTHGERGEFTAAEADFRLAEEKLRESPDEAARYGVWVNRGVLRIRQKDFPAAVADLTQAVRFQPDEYAAYVNLAEAYQGLQRWDDATAQLDRALALRPPHALAAIYRTRSRLHRQRGDLQAALDDLAEALRHEPNASADAAADWHERGDLFLEQRQYDSAVAAFDAALAIQSDRSDVHRARADALLHLGRTAEAVRAMDHCLKQDQAAPSGLAVVYLARGRAHTQLGNHAAAAEDFTRVLQLEPNHTAACAERGWSYLAVDAPALAERDFGHVLEVEPSSADALCGRGLARVRRGQYRTAVKDTEAALHLGEPDVRVLYTAARTFAQAVLRVEEETPTLDAAARELRRQYQERSLLLLRQALERMPAEQRVRFWQQTIQTDRTLGPLRRDAGFARLAEQYAPAATVEKMR